MGRAVPALMLAALALALGACGGDGYPEKPQEVAKAYVASNAASKCRFLSQELIETLTERQGADARAACRQNVQRFAAPRSVRLRDAEVDEHDAEVELLSDGKEAALKLEREGGRWRISGFSE